MGSKSVLRLSRSCEAAACFDQCALILRLCVIEGCNWLLICICLWRSILINNYIFLQCTVWRWLDADKMCSCLTSNQLQFCYMVVWVDLISNTMGCKTSNSVRFPTRETSLIPVLVVIGFYLIVSIFLCVCLHKR